MAVGFKGGQHLQCQSYPIQLMVGPKWYDIFEADADTNIRILERKFRYLICLLLISAKCLLITCDKGV